jgi:hypothetical protein
LPVKRIGDNNGYRSNFIENSLTLKILIIGTQKLPVLQYVYISTRRRRVLKTKTQKKTPKSATYYQLIDKFKKIFVKFTQISRIFEKIKF